MQLFYQAQAKTDSLRSCEKIDMGTGWQAEAPANPFFHGFSWSRFGNPSSLW
jgi:hypothetical protein